MARCHVTVDKLVKYSAGARAAGSLAAAGTSTGSSAL